MKKLFLYSLAVCLVILVAATSIIYLYQDQIIRIFVNELNKSLTAKVAVKKIDLSLFDKFPQVALSFTQLEIEGALPEHKQPLAKADRLYLTFDFWNIFSGKYKVNEVFLEEADVQIVVDKKGDENYQIFKKGDSTGTSQEVNFDLEQIHLNGVKVMYTDLKNDQVYDLFANKASASLQVKAEEVFVALQGSLKSQAITIGKYSYFTGKDISVESELIYHLEKRHLQIKPSVVAVKGSAFLVEGTFENHSSGNIDLQLEGKNTDIQTIISLLPTQYANELSIYKSKGKVYFDSEIKGATFNGGVPAIQVQFGCENASLYQQDIDKRIENTFVTGRFSNGKKFNRSTSLLELTNIKGVLEGKPFNGNFAMSNFDNPYLKFDISGEIDVASLLSFYPVKGFSQANGTLQSDISFEGKLTDLRAKAVNQFVRTSGRIQVKDLSFQLKENPVAFRQINGDFTFNKSDLLVNNLQGFAGNSDFSMNGLFKNILAYAFFKEQPLQATAEFTSKMLDFDELLAKEVSSRTKTQQNNASEGNYHFTISPWLALDITCKVDQLKFRRFKASQIEGNLQVNNQVAKGRDIRFRAADGSIQVEGVMDARQPEHMQVNCNAAFKNIAIDSVFFMFENFDQEFITDKHLRGQVTALVQTSMTFNNQLDLDAGSLQADAQTNVVNGGLVNFDPMQKLSKFINEEQLANIRFSEMENTIHIANRTVYMPEMEIRSTISNISVRGTHTFDQVMDYRLKIPTYNLSRKRAVAVADEEKTSNLFLSIKGTADDYKIAYDQEAVKEKIKEDIKEEKQQLKSLFKGKKVQPEPSETAKKKTAEAKEEFFDW